MNSSSSNVSPTPERDRLIFALDYADPKEAEAAVKRLGPHVGFFKVGLELFTAAGPAIIRAAARGGRGRVFLDLKFHDIPATVHSAVRAATVHGEVWMTVHSAAGGRALRAAVEGGGKTARILAVTVLTSLETEDMAETGMDPSLDLSGLVLRRARMALQSGCAGVVCSGAEVRTIKKEAGPDFIAVVPGIRPEWARVATEDQRRVITPGAAVLAGADYLVVGRPIREAPDPAGAADRVVAEMESARRSLQASGGTY